MPIQFEARLLVRTPGLNERDAFWMRRAIAEAWRGQGAVEPNPMVGAVIVRDDQLISYGYHRSFGGPHAEANAIASTPKLLCGATIYVTLEPCCHFGKTPPCTQALISAGISRIVVAQSDPFPKVAGGGIAQLREAGLDVEIGVEAKLARELNAPYLKRIHTGKPYVTAKWAMTLDGKIATATRNSQWISSPGSRARVHELRGRMDGILVGIGTAIADDPSLTARPAGPRTPVRIILDPSCKLPPHSRLAQTAYETPVWIVVNQRAAEASINTLEQLGCEIIRMESKERIDVTPLMNRLGERGLTNLLVEGGGQVLGAFLDAGEVDAIDAFIAPIIEGGNHAGGPFLGRGQTRMADAIRLGDLHIETVEGDVRVRGILPAPWRQIG